MTISHPSTNVQNDRNQAIKYALLTVYKRELRNPTALVAHPVTAINHSTACYMLVKNVFNKTVHLAGRQNAQ